MYTLITNNNHTTIQNDSLTADNPQSKIHNVKEGGTLITDTALKNVKTQIICRESYFVFQKHTEICPKTNWTIFN